MSTQLNTMGERFDKKFANIYHIHRGECAITDITGTKFEAHTDENGLVTQVGGLESIKDFIQSEIDLAVAEDRKRIVEGIEDKKRLVFIDTSNPRNREKMWADNGYNEALRDILSLITKDL